MSAMNPFKFLGGLVLEIGAVIGVLAVLPAMGPQDSTANTSLTSEPNQVFFNAQSSRVYGEPALPRPAPPAVWQNDFAATPPPAQQRFVEDTLDFNSQRVLDAATRLTNRGDQLLPPELRVPRERIRDESPPIVREFAPATPATQPFNSTQNSYPAQRNLRAQSEPDRPSYYNPARNNPQPDARSHHYNDRY